MGVPTVRLGPASTTAKGRVRPALLEAATRASPWLEARLQRHIIDAAEDFGCEIIVSTDARLSPETVSQLRQRGARVALWFADAVSNLGRMLMFACDYDILYFKDPRLVGRLVSMTQLPVKYLPESCNPEWHRPIGEAGIDPTVVVVGNLYPTRIRVLERLARHGIPLRVYGGRTPRFAQRISTSSFDTRPPVFQQDKALVFHNASAVLNNLHPAEEGANRRLFEGAGSGAVVLCEERPAISELFEPSRELLLFHDFDSLLAQATRALEGSPDLLTLRESASFRAHRDHSHSQRLTQILGDLA